MATDNEIWKYISERGYIDINVRPLRQMSDLGLSDVSVEAWNNQLSGFSSSMEFLDLLVKEVGNLIDNEIKKR